MTSNVKDFGASGDGRTDDTPAFAAALSAAGASGAIYAPAGTYRLTSVVTFGRWQRLVGDGNATVLLVDHNGDGLKFSSAAGPADEARNAGATHVRMHMGTGKTPTMIAIEDVMNVLLYNLSFFDAVMTTGIECRQGYGLRIVDCVFNSCTAAQCIWLRQSAANTPFWTVMPEILGLDITGIKGKGIVFDSAAGAIRDSIIEGCSSDALTLCHESDLKIRASIHLDTVYFEGNAGFSLRDVHPDSSLWAKATNCQFYAGGVTSSTNCNGRYIFENCIANPGNSMTGTGTVRLRHCIGMATSFSSMTMKLLIEDRTRYWADPAGNTSQQEFQNGINVNGGYGGGAALILCSAMDGSADSTVAELFLVRYGFDANAFEVESVKRSVGRSSLVFTFSVDARGFLRVKVGPGAGHAKYVIVTQTSDANEPLWY
jgi:hypothetical protein